MAHSWWRPEVLRAFEKVGSPPQPSLRNAGIVFFKKLGGVIQSLGWAKLIPLLIAFWLTATTLATSPPVFIDSISLPASVRDLGHEPDIFRQKVVDELTTMEAASVTAQDKTFAPPQDFPRYEIPNTPILISTVTEWLQRLLQKEPTHIRVVLEHPQEDFSQKVDEEKFRMTLHVNAGNTGRFDSSVHLEFTAQGTSDLINKVGQEILRQTNPVGLAAYLYLDRSDREGAQKTIAEIVSADDVGISAWVYNLQGVLLTDANQYKESMRAFEQAHSHAIRIADADERQNSVIYIYNNLAGLYYATGRRDDASYVLERAISDYPSHVITHGNLASMLLESDRFDEAERVITNALKQFPDEPDPLFTHGMLLVRQGAPDEAVPVIQKAVSMDPTKPRGYDLLSIAQSRAGHQEEARKAFEKALSIDPLRAETYGNRATILMEQGRPEEALDVLDDAIRLRPRFGQFHELRARIYAADGNWDEAEKEFRRALEMNPRFAGASENLAEMLINTRRPAEALRVLDEALSYAPMSDTLLSLKAGAHFSRNQIEQAYDTADNAISLNPRNPDAYAIKGLIYERRGETGKAIEAFNQAISFGSQMQVTYEYVAILLRNQPEKAAEALRRGLLIVPDNVVLREKLSYILETIPGREAEAKMEREKAVELRKKQVPSKLNSQ